MRTPYDQVDARGFWKRSVSGVEAFSVDPVIDLPFRIDRQTKIMSAGSCFAANVTRHLVRFGYNYVFAETLQPFFRLRDPAYPGRMGLGDYSAAYGNIYTPVQMLQTLERAYGLRAPVEDRWLVPEGRLIDPFRPRIEFRAKSDREFEQLRAQHFAAIRRAVDEADMFIFTFGLTESWRDRRDGTIYPVCPGAIGGRFDPDHHEFVNFTVADTVAATRAVIAFLRDRKPDLKFLFTVSPVPLVATATGNHVLTATTYSKSVLRVAAEEIVRSEPGCAYFPSYEIITGPHAAYEVFDLDRRSVSEAGIRHVMRLFFRHFAQDDDAAAALSEPGFEANAPATPPPADLATALAEAACEEELIEMATRTQSDAG